MKKNLWKIPDSDWHSIVPASQSNKAPVVRTEIPCPKHHGEHMATHTSQQTDTVHLSVTRCHAHSDITYAERNNSGQGWKVEKYTASKEGPDGALWNLATRALRRMLGDEE